jgi:hypothetical protein
MSRVAQKPEARSRVWVVDRYAVVQSRTYLFVYIVLLHEALPRIGKNRIVQEQLSLYRPALRLFCRLLFSDNAIA